MLILRLFDKNDPENPVDARIIGDDIITIGRDQTADWTITDRDNQISRIHCTVQLWNGRLLVTDQSSNGVYLGAADRRMTRDTPVAMDIGQRFYFGSSFIEIARPINGNVHDRTIMEQPTAGEGQSCSDTLAEAVDADSNRPSEGVLLKAFCEAAGVEVSSLVEEEGEAVMRRLGSIYREVIDGVSKLVEQRAQLRETSHLDRTTIGAQDNNPFKWAPEQNLAADLLKPGTNGFLTGNDAVRSCFDDITSHLAAVTAGLDGVAEGMLDALAPERIENGIGRNFSLTSESAKCWKRYVALHQELRSDRTKRAHSYERMFRARYLETSDVGAD